MSEHISGSLTYGIKSMAWGAPFAACYRLAELYPQFDPHPFVFAGVFAYGYWVKRAYKSDFLDVGDIASAFVGSAVSYLAIAYAIDRISRLL